MLITEEDILSRFEEHLSWADEIDLATAWVTINDGLLALRCRAPSLKVRTVVGLWGNVTDPDALRILADIGQLRMADSSRRFHPKVFLFRGAGKSVAWIGSANFTSGGFGMNVETLFETTDTESVKNWFNGLWEHCGPLEQDAIDNYEEWIQENPPSPLLPPPDTGDMSPMKLLEAVTDWNSYVAALERCDGWWRKHSDWSVLGEQPSWLNTVQVLHDIITQQDWREIDKKYDRQRLLGLTKEGGWELLGRMRRPALDTVFGGNRKAIQKIVLDVVAAHDDTFPELAFKSYETLKNIGGIGQGIATRLLTLARPDRFVSLNGASEIYLAEHFGLPRTTLGKPENYRLLLEKIYSQDWYNAPRPGNPREQIIYEMRAALLDSFVYIHQDEV